MRGMVGRYAQGMAPKKGQPALETRVVDDNVSGSRTSTAPFTGTAFVFLWGGGGSGAAGATPSGGGGAGACYAKFRVTRNQVLSYTVGAAGASASGADGNAGGTSSLTFQSKALSATGGGAGLLVGTGGAGGAGLRGRCEPQRRAGGNGTSGSVAGTNGGAAGSSGGGGGAAGFTDQLGPTGAAGTAGGVSSGAILDRADTPGGGGGGNGNGAGGSSAGGKGRVIIIYTRALL
jgi:hypothetical protein